MAVTFTLVNPNDSTPANNQVVVDVTLQPAVECHVEAELSSPDTDLTIGRTYVAAVRVTNTGVADLHALAVVFGDVQGYEVRPITTPVWDADSGLVVTNPDWKSPALQPGAYLVALKHALPPGATAVYYARIVRRSVETEQEIFFDVYGPCGDTGVYAALELGASEARITILPRGQTPEDSPLPDGGISIALPSALDLGPAEENAFTQVDFVIDTQQVIPAGSWLRINNGYQVSQYGDITFILYPADYSVTPAIISPLLLEASFTTVLAAVPSGLIAPAADNDMLGQFAMPVPVGRTVIPGVLYGFAEGRISTRATASITADQAGATVLLGSTYVEGNGDSINSAWILNDFEDHGDKRPALSERGESSLLADNPGETYDCKVVLEVGTEIPPMSYLIVRNAEAGTSSNGGQHYSLALDLVGQPITLQYLGTIPAVGAQPCFESSSDAVYRLTDGVAEGVWTLAGSFAAATANYPDCSNALTVHVTSDPQGENLLAVFANTATLSLAHPH